MLRCEGFDLFLMPNICDLQELQELQELQCYLIVHIRKIDCKSKLLMCICCISMQLRIL